MFSSQNSYISLENGNIFIVLKFVRLSKYTLIYCICRVSVNSHTTDCINLVLALPFQIINSNYSISCFIQFCKCLFDYFYSALTHWRLKQKNAHILSFKIQLRQPYLIFSFLQTL